MRRKEGGRFTVGDKGFTSRLSALAYALSVTSKDGATRYVREIGKQGSLHIIERDGRVTAHRPG